SREYLSVSVYQVMNPEVVSSIWSASVLDENAWLPMKSIRAILATSPSKISKATPTRLRGKGVMIGVTSTPYLPLDRYCCLSSKTARSSMAWSKIRPWPKPTCEDRKSTRLNSSHVKISYAVFCLKKKKQ